MVLSVLEMQAITYAHHLVYKIKFVTKTVINVKTEP